MYIQVGFGQQDNLKNFNTVDYNYDAQPLYKANGNPDSSVVTRYTTSNNAALGQYAGLPNAVIEVHISNNVYTRSVTKDGVTTKRNKNIIDGLGFGSFENADDCIIPGKISYSNHTALTSSDPINWTSPWTSDRSLPNTAYIPVDVGTSSEDTPPEPAFWETQKYVNYYHEEGTGKNLRMRVFQPTGSILSTWTGFCEYCRNNNITPYYNNAMGNWIWFGDGDAKVIFACARNGNGCQITDGVSKFAYSGIYHNGWYGTENFGYLRLGSTFDAPQLTIGTNFAQNNISDVVSTAATNAMIEGRFSTDTQYSNPICDCTLMQFGTFTYDNKQYFGVWSVGYEPQYYWGYKRKNNTGSWEYENLDTDSPVNYDNPEIYSVRFYGICLADLGVIVEQHEGSASDKDDPIPSFNYPYTPIGFHTPGSLGILADPNGSGFHIYAMTSAAFSSLSEQLWSWGNYARQFLTEIEDHGFLDSVTSLWSTFKEQAGIDPSRCVVFARKMPKTVPMSCPSNLYEVRLAGEPIGIKAKHFTKETCSSANYSISVSGPTKSFLDYAPYCSAALYLPYIGQVTIDPVHFMDGTIQIQYHFDIISGKCVAQVICTGAARGVGNKREFVYGPYAGDCSVDVPLAIQDANVMARQYTLAKAAVNGASQIAGGIAGMAAGGVGAGAILSGATTIASAAADYAMTKRQTTTVCDVGSMVASMLDPRIILQFTFPATVNFSDTQLEIGMSAYKPGTVGQFTGFTKFTYVDTSGINATSAEKEAISRLLKEGVYL